MGLGLGLGLDPLARLPVGLRCHRRQPAAAVALPGKARVLELRARAADALPDEPPLSKARLRRVSSRPVWGLLVWGFDPSVAYAGGAAGVYDRRGAGCSPR